MVLYLKYGKKYFNDFKIVDFEIIVKFCLLLIVGDLFLCFFVIISEFSYFLIIF